MAADMIAEFYGFQLAYGRKPDTWRDFRYGMDELARERARLEMTAANSARLAQDTGKEFGKYHRRLSVQAGYTRTE